MKSNIVGDYLKETNRNITSYLCKNSEVKYFKPLSLKNAVLSYIKKPKKCLRPALLTISSNLAGGNPSISLPGAAGIELFHTWTLVHDDIMDNDNLRRGNRTVHCEFSDKAKDKGLSLKLSMDYGRNMAIMAGDSLQGWSVASFSNLVQNGIKPEVTNRLIYELEIKLLNKVMEGQTLDIECANLELDQVSYSKIYNLIKNKTAELLKFCMYAGVIIGSNSFSKNIKLRNNLVTYAENIGLAFQIIDDILGIVGNKDKFGKPIGSDIREGKKTILLYLALERMTKKEKLILKKVFAQKNPLKSEVKNAINLIISVGAVDAAYNKANQHIKKALKAISQVAECREKELLKSIAQFIISRSH